MAINFVRTRDGSDESLHFQPIERLKVYLFGATILFASFGMGEAVYRLLFSEFDGMTDRIPIEVLFGKSLPTGAKFLTQCLSYGIQGSL